VEFLGFLDDYEDVLGHMRAADVFASPSTREGFDSRLLRRWPRTARLSPLTTPIRRPTRVIGDAGFLTDPTVDGIAETLAQTLTGGRPAVDPVERAQRFDWNTVASQAETVYRRVADGDSDPIEADTTVGTSS